MTPKLIEVTVLLLDGTFSSTAIGPLEVFQHTGALWNMFAGKPQVPRFRVTTASADGREVLCDEAIHIRPSAAMADVRQTDIVFVPSTGPSLEDAVERKRHEKGASFSLADLRDSVMEGALLRLRPKVMTVSTIVAGLLPIMWSQRVGAEVIKPLATPVLGGMVSSLLHVLIVTPVIFLWLRERALKKEQRLKETNT